MTDLKTATTVEVDGLQVRLIFSPLASEEIPCMIRTAILHMQGYLKTKGVRYWASEFVAYIASLH